MPFVPFTPNDFAAMNNATAAAPPDEVNRKADELRRDLCGFPEFQLEFFGKRIRRRQMRGSDGLVFGRLRWDVDRHWYLFNVGGDQDQVQLNIGMWPTYIRVGLGFQIGRQVSPKMPAFQLFQTFLGIRPPLPFRDAFYRVVERNGLRIEGEEAASTAADVLSRVETYVVPPDSGPVFVFVGALWDVHTASGKTAEGYRAMFHELMPFYEELILAGGRYVFSAP